MAKVLVFPALGPKPCRYTTPAGIPYPCWVAIMLIEADVLLRSLCHFSTHGLRYPDPLGSSNPSGITSFHLMWSNLMRPLSMSAFLATHSLYPISQPSYLHLLLAPPLSPASESQPGAILPLKTPFSWWLLLVAWSSAAEQLAELLLVAEESTRGTYKGCNMREADPLQSPWIVGLSCPICFPLASSSVVAAMAEAELLLAAECIVERVLELAARHLHMARTLVQDSHMETYSFPARTWLLS